MKPALIAVDWGTSSFRAALMDGEGRVLAQLATGDGGGSLSPDEFEPLLFARLAPWLEQWGSLPVVMCGMVGSSLGWHELPYRPAPIDLLTLGDRVQQIAQSPVPVWLVPGVQGPSPWGELDVMRGEETQILGWLLGQPAPERAVLCLPGTHTKWALLEDGQLQQLSTAFSGEVYALLHSDSILVRGEQRSDDGAFRAGLERSGAGEALSHTLFTTRSRVLAGQMEASRAASYLSGLLLGAEVAGLLRGQPEWLSQPVDLVGSPELVTRYRDALAFFHVDARPHDGAELVFRGLFYLANHCL